MATINPKFKVIRIIYTRQLTFKKLNNTLLQFHSFRVKEIK